MRTVKFHSKRLLSENAAPAETLGLITWGELLSKEGYTVRTC